MLLVILVATEHVVLEVSGTAPEICQIRALEVVVDGGAIVHIVGLIIIHGKETWVMRVVRWGSSIGRAGVTSTPGATSEGCVQVVTKLWAID